MRVARHHSGSRPACATGPPPATTNILAPQPNPLPAAAMPGGPRFHISLREHHVYNLEEARRFCSERCLTASAALAALLLANRPFGVRP